MDAEELVQLLNRILTLSETNGELASQLADHKSLRDREKRNEAENRQYELLNQLEKQNEEIEDLKRALKATEETIFQLRYELNEAKTVQIGGVGGGYGGAGGSCSPGTAGIISSK